MEGGFGPSLFLSITNEGGCDPVASIEWIASDPEDERVANTSILTLVLTTLGNYHNYLSVIR